MIKIVGEKSDNSHDKPKTFVFVIAILIALVLSNVVTRLTVVYENGPKHTTIHEKAEHDPYVYKGEEIFLSAAINGTPVTDKVTTHRYQTMYGQYLLPYYKKNSNMKMLEIGLGCDMNYGPGASATLHKLLFPLAELWEADFNAACVESSIENGSLDGFHTLVGDQGNIDVLDQWVLKSGGNFDVIIDDGGHDNCQIWTSFLKLWPTLKKGGLYFIEDLQVAKHAQYQKVSSELCEKGTIVPDKIKEIQDKLLYNPRQNYMDVKFVFCQREACVVGKDL